MKRCFLLLIGIIALLGLLNRTSPEKETESGPITVMVVSATEEPYVLEGITEEMLIDQIISEKRPFGEEEQKHSTNKKKQAFFLKTLSKIGE